jgi:toxin ParE1/3/4
MPIELSRFVEPDLEAIADYIAQDNPERALSFLAEIRAKLVLIESNPLVYRLRPEIGEEARVAVVGRYVILFRIIDDTIRIERIVFGGRDLPQLLE